MSRPDDLPQPRRDDLPPAKPQTVPLPPLPVAGPEVAPPRVRRSTRARTAVAVVAAVAAGAGVTWWTTGRDSGAEVVRSLRVSGHPIGITANDDGVWVVGDEDGGPVRRIDEQRVVILDTHPVGRAPYGIAATGGIVWVANGLGDSVSRIDADRVDEIPVGRAPYAIVATEEGVLVSNSGDGTLAELGADGSARRVIDVGGNPQGLAVDRSTAWVAISGDAPSVVEVDLRSGEVIGSIELTGAPDAVAVAAGSIWVTDVVGGTVTRIDPVEREVTATIDVGSGPQGLAVLDSAVWVSVGGADEVVRIEPDTDEVVERIGTKGEPIGMVAVAGRLWVADHADGIVEVIEP